MPQTTWTGSLHQTFRLLGAQSGNLLPFLEADGLTADEVLKRLPYDSSRSRRGAGATPSPKRYRDGRQVYQTVGLLYEGDDARIHVTELGAATRRWAPIINPENSIILARHAAYALSACQLRNPSGFGSKFDESVEVFPFQFIWRAMIGLEGRISSEELNRAIFKVCNEGELGRAIAAIAEARARDDLTVLGEEVIEGRAKNDRIIPWMSLASFGWTLFADKRGGDAESAYHIPGRTLSILREASQIRHRHREFESTQEYVEHLSSSACLPKDLR